MTERRSPRYRLLLVIGLLALAANGFAQSSPEAQLREMSSKLQLTEKQKVQMAPLVGKQFRDFKALKENTSMGKLQKLRQAKALQANFHNEASRVLKPDQMKKLEEMQAERRASFSGR
jgi:predicted component of type VI protein secretion system